MGSSFDNLPYQIPGPAGGVSYQTLSQEQRGELNKNDTSRIFQQPAWHALLDKLQAPPFGHSHLQCSVALLRSYALSDRFQRVARLAVLIDAMCWVGRDASVKLRDPTGVIRATVHAEVFDKWKTGIEIGAALVLDGVAAVAYVERRPKGFRTDAGEALHVSIQLCHVHDVFVVGKGVIASKKHLSVKVPKASYAPVAVAPPVMKRPPSRRAPRPPPPPHQRMPLKPRQVHQVNKSKPWPTSAAAIAPHRGGFNGHLQRPEQAIPSTNYHPPVGHQPKKRPFTPHHVPAPLGSRQSGMQPLSKRPTPQRPPAPIRVNPPIVPSAATSAGLTDDQLDDLLGDLDVDAVIAASGRSPAMKIPTATGSGRKSECVAEVSRSGLQKSSLSGNLVATLPADGESNMSSEAEKTPDFSDVSIIAPSINVLETAAGRNVLGNVPNVNARVAALSDKSGQEPLPAVDEAMIDNLFDGLENSDFG